MNDYYALFFFIKFEIAEAHDVRVPVISQLKFLDSFI